MKNKLFKIPAFILMGFAIAFLIGEVVMLLWNELIPVIFHLPLITFWQAFGLLILFKILFGSGFHGNRNCNKKNFKSMSPEDTEKYIELWKKHFDTKSKHFSDSNNTAQTDSI